jgi:molybdopterin molybdotransferase
LHSHEHFDHLTNVDDALEIFLKTVEKYHPKRELQPLTNCVGRVLAEDVAASQDFPSFDRSVMDGFAIRSLDVQTSLPSLPVMLDVIGESRLGQDCGIIVKRSQGVSVATGSIIPKGADSVVPIEDILQVSKHRISLSSPVPRGQNILHKGEDFSRGKVILEVGRRLRPQDLGALKVLGFSKVHVARKPRIGVMSTGSELVEKNAPKSRGKIVDINRLILLEMVAECGGEGVDLGIVDDDQRSIRDALRKALRSCNLILVSGGSSMGQRDLVPECINLLGRPGMMVHGVAMRPAMPTGLALVNHVPIISLPGVPVSAIFAFHVFGLPMISRLLGEQEVTKAPVRAVLSERVQGVLGFRFFVRVKLKRTEMGLVAEPLKNQKSSVLKSMVDADAYVVIPEGVAEIQANETVEVTLLR